MNQNSKINLASEIQDPRYFQILYLFTFLSYGVLELGWEMELQKFLFIGIACLSTQLFFILYKGLNFHSVKSGLITALGLCLLLKVNDPLTGALAAVLAISSKFIIQTKRKHIFNPANFGIVAALVLTGDAWVSPGQWGSDILLLFMLGAAGLIMLLKVGRLDTAFSFLIAFAVLEYSYTVLYLGWEPYLVSHKLINGTLLLFTFFMITDPRTTPNHKRARMVWGIILALATFTVSQFLYAQTAAIWVLFFMSPFTPLFDKIWKGETFQWKTLNLSKTQTQ